MRTARAARLPSSNRRGKGASLVQRPVSRKSRKLFASEKLFVKLRLAYSVKLVFSYVVKAIKIKITAKFRASRRLSFEENYVTRNAPVKFRDFRETGSSPEFFRAFPRYCFSNAITVRIIYTKRLFFLIKPIIILFCRVAGALPVVVS